MRFKRLISAFITCAMLVTFMPMQAFAADDLPEVAEYYESFDEESPMEIGARATRSETIELGESKTLVGKLGGLDKWGTSNPDVIEVKGKWDWERAKPVGTITALQMSDDPVIITHKYGLSKEEQWEITVTPPAAKFFVLKAAGNEPESGADQGQDNYYPNAKDTIEVDGITYNEATGLPGSLTEKGYELLQANDGEYFALDGKTLIDDKLVIEPEQEFMNALRDVAGLSDKQEIVWYVMKDQEDGYHVDGYVSNIPVTVTYKTGYPEASGIENKTFADTAAFTGSYELLSPEACGFRPSGYTFTGWKLENSETDKTYELNTSFELTKAETFVAQWEKDEESAGSTAAYFYVLKPEFEGDPSTATPENFYYVGQGSIENPHVGEAEGQRYTEPQKPVTGLPSNITAKLENIVWYRVGQANGANSNGDTPVVSDGTTTWHVDGCLTASLTVNAVNSENEQEFSGLANWPKSKSIRVGTEYTVVVGEDNNATIEVPQTITVDGQHYAYDAPKQDEQDGDLLSGKMQLNGATVKIPYAPDNNDNGDPDVTETRYAVTYTWDNAPAGSQLPSDQTLYLEGDTVGVHGPYTKDAVVKGVQDGVKGFYTFSGWKLENQVVTTFTMPNHEVTLVGTWTFTKDENDDQIPDERQIFVNYRSNDTDYGTVSAEAANKVFTFTEGEIATAKTNGGKLPVRKLHAQATETSDGDFDRWTTSADFGTLFPVYRATLNVDVIFTVDQLGKTLEVAANFDRETGGGGAHHPDARDDDDDDDDRDDDDEEEIIDEEVPLAETLWLNTEDHYAYIVGYSEDGTVRPNANITRAEVATIFFRLLTDEARDQFWMTTNNFSDVLPNDWYNNAVSTMVNAGIIQGYEDGTFRPNANITRAEFAAIAARFMSSGYDVEEDLFTDIANHWARESINDAAMAGWINGYEDGTFRPDAAITRAEAVTLVNNVLQRKPDADHMFDSMIKWPDNPKGTWYYEAIQEATNSHDYDLFEDAEYETWTALQENRDWAALEKDWVNAHRTGGEVM